MPDAPDPTALFRAVFASDLDAVRQCLAAGADLDARTDRGRTPLMVAAGLGHDDVVAALLVAGAPPDVVVDEEGPMRLADEEPEDEDEYLEAPTTALAFAVAAGRREAVERLLAAGASPTPPRWHDTPPLVYAAARGHRAIVDALLQAGAPVDHGLDRTPLAIAAGYGHAHVVRTLLVAGADPNAEGEDEETALLAAAAAGHREIVEILVEAGADPCHWAQGETALGLAARDGHDEVQAFLEPLVDDEIRAAARREGRRAARETLARAASDPQGEKLVEAAMMGEAAKVDKLLAAGAPVDYLAENGQTALMCAAAYGHAKIVETLLAASADPEVRARGETTERGRTALMAVAGSFFCRDREGLIRRLIEAGADVNARDDAGRTVLRVALDGERDDSLRTLLELGADPDLADSEGVTPLMVVMAAETNMRPESIEAFAGPLRAAGASEEGLANVRLLLAAGRGDLDAARELLAAGADFRYRRTPLIEAADGDLELVRLLLDAGADPNRAESDPPEDPEEAKDWQGDFNALLHAAYDGHLEVVRLLVDRGTDVHARNALGTALDYARLGKRERRNPDRPWDEVIRFLESGAPSHRRS